MGFRNGAYAMVWEVKPKSQMVTQARISISRKDKNTGAYEQDFGGWVSFVGTATAASAARLQPRDKIKLGDVDTRTTFDKEKRVTYYDFTVFSFEPADGNSPGQGYNNGGMNQGYNNGGAQYGGQRRGSGYGGRQVYQPQPYRPEVGDGEPDPFDEDSLPF